MPDYYELCRNGTGVNIYPGTAQGQTDAQTELDARIAADLVTFGAIYSDPKYELTTIIVSVDAKGIRLQTSENGLSLGMAVTNVTQETLVCWDIREFNNEF